MSEELEVLKEVTRRLDRAKIAYMVTGSIASNFYTIPRMTRDIDIVVELAEEDSLYRSLNLIFIWSRRPCATRLKTKACST